MSKYGQLPRGTMMLLSNNACGGVIGQDFVNWAVEALVDGFDSPSLRILAGLDMESSATHLPVSKFEAHDYFRKIVRELAWPISDVELNLSSPETCVVSYDEIDLRQHLDDPAEQIREGVIDPVMGVERIHTEVVEPLHHSSDLRPWCFLWEGNTPDGHYGDYSEEEYSTKIISYATKWLENIAAKKTP